MEMQNHQKSFCFVPFRAHSYTGPRRSTSNRGHMSHQSPHHHPQGPPHLPNHGHDTPAPHDHHAHHGHHGHHGLPPHNDLHMSREQVLY